MKSWSRFLLAAACALGLAATAHAQLSLTGVSASPSSVSPGDTVTLTASVSNIAATRFDGTADFSIVLTNLATGATFTISGTGVSPVGGFIGPSTTNPQTGQVVPGTGSFAVTGTVPHGLTVGVGVHGAEAGGYKATVTMTNAVNTGGTVNTVTSSPLSVTSTVVTVNGTPDLQITSLTYAAGTSYVGGTVIPMQLTYRNNSSTNAANNVPYLPGGAGFPAFARIKIVLSANPTFGDGDDFQLTFLDINSGNVGTVDNAGNPAVLPDNSTHTFNWNQLLPGNFTGSFYVLAKIDALDQLTENDPSPLTVNGNNIWGVPALQPEGTRINLLPANFPATFLGSHEDAKTTSSNGYSDNPSLSADGRYLVFASDATNLVANDTNAARDIFIFDNQTSLIRRLSVSQQGTPANGPSNNPAISGDSRYVAFASEANNLIVGDTNGFSDIYVVDTITGLISRMSVAVAGATSAQANNPSFRPAISSNGRYVAFESTATNLDASYTITSGSHIYVHDRDVNGSGVFDTAGNTSTRLVDVDVTAPLTTVANANSIHAAISADGAVIGFASRATNLVAPATTAGRQHVYIRPRTSVGTGASGVRLVSVANTTAAEGNADSQTPSLNSDGRYIAFGSVASNLVASDTNGVSDVFVYDAAQPVATPIVRRMSVATNGAQAYDPSAAGFALGSINPTISATGRYVSFASLAANLSTGDVVGQYQGSGATASATVVGGAITALPVTSGGTQYSQASPPLVIIVDTTGTGATATAVVSAAGVVTGITVNSGGSGYTAPTIIIASDANRALDIFIHDRDAAASGTFDTGTTSTQLVSVNSFGYQTGSLLGSPSTAASNIYPVLSSNGRYVAFPSDAENTAGLAFGVTNQAPLDSNGVRDVFLADRRTTAGVTPPTPPSVTITNPGNASNALVNTPIAVTASATTSIGVVATVQFFVNGASIGSSSVFPYTATWTPTAVGNYVLSALVTDSFGNLGVSPNVAVTINAAPSVGITAPTASSTISAGSVQTVTASASASNPGATIASVQFFVNGASLGPAVVTPPYSVSWTPNAAGSYTLTAVATDSIGTQTTSPSVTVTVSPAGGGGGGGGGVSPPTIAIVSPANGSTVPVNAAQTVTATASSVNGTVTTVNFFANGVAIGSASAFPYSVVWTPVTPGTYAITATAIDTAGAQATSTPNNVTVTSGSAPTVTLSSPANGAAVPVGTTQTLVANAVPGSGTIVDVQFFANGVSLGTDTTFPYNFAWSPTGVGSVSLTAVATDSLGNRTTSPAVSVTVVSLSPSAPTVAITSPSAGAALPIGSATTISASATDPDGTIFSVQFFANGVPIAGADTTFPYSVDFQPVSPGGYILTAQAIDNGGNIATSAPISVTVAGGAAPSVALTSPVAGAVLAVNAPQTLTASASSPSGFITNVQFFINGTPVGAPDTTFPYSADWTPTSVGTYSLSARATDNIGNITDSAPIVVTAAASAGPTVSVTNPVNGSAYTVGTALTLTASAADPDGTITSVQFLVNGVLQGAPDATAPYTANWTPGSSGIYTIVARAIDNTGNVTTSSPVTVTIGANAAPTIALTSPVAGLSYALGTQVLVAASGSDADGTIANVQFFANGLLIGTSTAAPFVVSWKPTAAGNYTLTATATDNVGNATTSAPVNVTVTSVGAPSVAFTNPPAGSTFVVSNPIPLVATASGGNGPIAQVQFFVNGAPVEAADSTAPYSANWTPAAAGTYTLLAVATDSAGISATSAPLTVTITGNLPPTVAITNPASGTTVNAGSVVSLNAAASDADGTVASVRFLANGNVVATAAAAPFIGAWTPTAAGTYTIVAQAVDNSGNVTNSNSITVTVAANQAPSVSLTAPGNGTSVRVGAGVRLTATAADPDGTIASVQFFANGTAVGTPDTIAPYEAQWTPAAEGIYRLTAVALDNSGASATSSTVTVIAVAAGAGDLVYVGNYAGAGEVGRFAAVVIRGRTGAFIGFSSSGTSRVYFFPSLVVDTNGGFNALDAVGRSLVTGTASDTGVAGTFDNGRLTFIGVATLGGSSAVPSGYYNGSLVGRAASTFSAIVAPDGTIMAYAADGTFRDAGSGILNSSGTFTIVTLAGNRLTGTIDPVSGFLSGTLFGGPGGSVMAALASGVSFSDGFLRNLSTRGQVGTGANILIAGFVVGGSAPKQVMVRAIGPSLTPFGITGALADPQLQLFNGTTLIATNDNWGGAGDISTAANNTGAFPLNPTSLDSAILMTLPPGSYTAQVSGVGGRTGVALVELYDVDNLSPFSSQKVMNVATRGVVGSGQNQLIAGFAVSGNTAKKVLIRAVGPTLGTAPFNVGGVLADPILRLVRSDNAIIRENDNWEAGNDVSLINDASTRVGAFPLAPGGRDAAMLINLPPGTYSAQVSGPGTTTGVALVEVYEVP